MLTLFAFMAAVFAQQPAATVDTAAGPDHVWTTRAVDLKRFSDGDVVIVHFDVGQKLEVVVQDGDLLRVRRGTDFGWVPASAVSHEAPVTGAVGFQLGDGPPKLQAQP